VWVGLFKLENVASPKFHKILLAPVNPVNETPVSGAQPEVGVATICENEFEAKRANSVRKKIFFSSLIMKKFS
jgi:hypothetical protein